MNVEDESSDLDPGISHTEAAQPHCYSPVLLTMCSPACLRPAQSSGSTPCTLDLAGERQIGHSRMLCPPAACHSCARRTGGRPPGLMWKAPKEGQAAGPPCPAAAAQTPGR